MELFGCCFLLFLLLLGFLAGRRKSGHRNLPPGPPPLPIVGNLLDLGAKPHKSLANLARIHGPIMSLKLGQVVTIVVSSAETAKQVLQTHDQHLANRTIPDALAAKQHDQYSLPWIPASTRWRNLRKICNNQLFSSKVLDEKQHLRRMKVQELLDEVEKYCLAGEAIDIGKAAFKTTLNLLSNTFYSVDLADSDSDRAGEFKETVWNIMKEAGAPNLGDYFPVLKSLDLQGIRRRIEVHFGKMMDLFYSLIEQRILLRNETTSFSAANHDMLDSLLNICEENKDEMDNRKIRHLSVVTFLIFSLSFFCLTSSIWYLQDLFAAGTDTTTATVEWAMTELLHNPEIMSKAKKELEETIGKGKLIEESDITKLPYLQAIVKETFRMHPVVPLLLPRKAEMDVEICGYTVPKGGQVLVNVWAIGRDPKIWDDPELFKPERFLGSEIDAKGRSFELAPFGAGRRICIGLPLAIRMLHLVLGSLINSFNWKLEDGLKPEDMNMEDKFGVTLQTAEPVRAVPLRV